MPGRRFPAWIHAIGLLHARARAATSPAWRGGTRRGGWCIRSGALSSARSGDTVGHLHLDRHVHHRPRRPGQPESNVPAWQWPIGADRPWPFVPGSGSWSSVRADGPGASPLSASCRDTPGRWAAALSAARDGARIVSGSRGHHLQGLARPQRMRTRQVSRWASGSADRRAPSGSCRQTARPAVERDGWHVSGGLRHPGGPGPGIPGDHESAARTSGGRWRPGR